LSPSNSSVKLGRRADPAGGPERTPGSAVDPAIAPIATVRAANAMKDAEILGISNSVIATQHRAKPHCSTMSQDFIEMNENGF
jgi:hypothetical protein